MFLPGDQIIRQGDIGNSMFFISSGKVQVYIGSDSDQGIEGTAAKFLNKFSLDA